MWLASGREASTSDTQAAQPAPSCPAFSNQGASVLLRQLPSAACSTARGAKATVAPATHVAKKSPKDLGSFSGCSNNTLRIWFLSNLFAVDSMLSGHGSTVVDCTSDAAWKGGYRVTPLVPTNSAHAAHGFVLGLAMLRLRPKTN